MLGKRQVNVLTVCHAEMGIVIMLAGFSLDCIIMHLAGASCIFDASDAHAYASMRLQLFINVYFYW